MAMLGELQEFYKRRSEVELEYSRGMDKLVKQIMTRHKTDKQRSVKYVELCALFVGLLQAVFVHVGGFHKFSQAFVFMCYVNAFNKYLCCNLHLTLCNVLDFAICAQFS